MSEKGFTHDFFPSRQHGGFGGTVDRRLAVTGSQLREAERRLVAKLRAEGYPRSWIERNVLELLAQASEEYAKWLEEHEPEENPAGWLSACAFRRALNLPAREGADENHISSSQEPPDLPVRQSRAEHRPVLRRWLIAGFAVVVCGLAVGAVHSWSRHDDSPRPRLREQTHLLSHRKSREAVTIDPSIRLGPDGLRRPAHRRPLRAKTPGPAKEQIEVEEGSVQENGGGWGSAPVSPPAQEATPAPPPAAPAAGTQVGEEFGL